MALEHRDAISPAIAMRQGNSKRQLASHSLLSSRPLNCQQEEMDKWIKSFLRISNTSKPLPAHGEVSESIHRTDEDDDDDDDDKAVDRSSTFSSQDSDSDERLSSRPHSDSSEDKTDSKSSSLAATTTRVVRVGFLQGPVVSKLRLHRVVAVLGGGVIVVVVIFISVTSVT